MGIYDKGLGGGQGFAFDLKQFKMPLLGLAGVVVLLFIVYGLSIAFQPHAMKLSFSDNPLVVTEDSQETILTVSLTNIQDIDASNAEITVTVFDSERLFLPRKRIAIGLLARNESRTVEFVIKPKVNIVSGDYRIGVIAQINDVNYSQEAMLSIKK
jgi:hypothetical protein